MKRFSWNLTWFILGVMALAMILSWCIQGKINVGQTLLLWFGLSIVVLGLCALCREENSQDFDLDRIKDGTTDDGPWYRWNPERLWYKVGLAVFLPATVLMFGLLALVLWEYNRYCLEPHSLIPPDPNDSNLPVCHC